MALKFLTQFVNFNMELFLSGKTLAVDSTSPWSEYETGKVLGTKVEVSIMKDDTPYNRKDGDNRSNLREKLTIKVPKNILLDVDTLVRPVNPRGTVYGDYRNQLSVVADDIEVLNKK